MKLLRRNLGNILISVCELLAGILLLINPERYTRVLIIIVGIVLVVLGVFNIVNHLRIPPLEASHSYRMSWGLMLAAGGLFCMFDAGWFFNAFPVLTMLYGVVLLAVGFIKIQWAVDMLRIGDPRWYLALISVGLAYIVAIILFINPTSNSRVLFIITGIVLIFSAVLDIVTILFRFMRQQEVAKEYKDIDRHQGRGRVRATSINKAAEEAVEDTEPAEETYSDDTGADSFDSAPEEEEDNDTSNNGDIPID